MGHTAIGPCHRRAGSPGARIGMWTVALAVASVAGIVLLALAFALGLVETADSFSDNWLLTGWGVAILASGAASVAAGALAIVRHHERSRIVLLAALFGLLTTAVILREVAQGL